MDVAFQGDSLFNRVGHVRKRYINLILLILVVLSAFSMVFHSFIGKVIHSAPQTDHAYSEDAEYALYVAESIGQEFLLIGGLVFAASVTSLVYRYLQGSAPGPIKFTRSRQAAEEYVAAPGTGSQNPVNGSYNSVARLKTMTEMTTRNSNINLAVGVFTTFIAIGVLTMTLVSDNYLGRGTIFDLYHYLPRLTLVIFIELFSFFFLKLYKRNLEDIKYLNNEITNFECKMIALNASQSENQTDSMKIVIEHLSTTERNFVLKKGESTVETQKLQIETDGEDRLWERILAALKGK